MWNNHITNDDVNVIVRALANAIDIILNNGEDPDVLAELLGLDDHKDLCDKFIGIYSSED